jgi:hypothetical protein
MRARHGARRRLAAAGQDEAGERFEQGVRRVDRLFEPFALRRHDPQRHVRRGEIVSRRGEVGAEIEQVVLDAGQRGGMRTARMRADRKADDAVRRVDRADRFHARGVLGQARAVDQPGGAVVAGARVDLVELYQMLIAADGP